MTHDKSLVEISDRFREINTILDKYDDKKKERYNNTKEFLKIRIGKVVKRKMTANNNKFEFTKIWDEI